MTITIRRDFGKESERLEVYIFEVERHFTQSELLEKLKYAFELSHQKGTTFLGVIDTDFPFNSVNQLKIFFDQFNFINELPRTEPEYRIGLVIEEQAFAEEKILESLRETPNSAGGWLWYLVQGAILGNSMINFGKLIIEEPPLVNNPWVMIQTNIDDAIDWCRQNATWQ